MIEILNRYTNAVIYKADVSGVRAAVLQAVSENVSLRSANLQYANLRSANLQYADLRSANLQYADLRSADLRYADLRSANLQYADLRSANLQSANLRSADLRSANLRSADLRFSDDTRLPTGETWKEYLTITLPELLKAGGKSVADVAAAWDCHTWENCPMHVAFSGAKSPSECPMLLRPRVEQFIQLFDAGLIPKPEVVEAA